MKLELQRLDWYEVFYNSSSTEFGGKFKEIINNFKICPIAKADSQKNKSIWMKKLTLSKIKMKNRAYHRFLKTKDQHDYQMYAKYRN